MGSLLTRGNRTNSFLGENLTLQVFSIKISLKNLDFLALK